MVCFKLRQNLKCFIYYLYSVATTNSDSVYRTVLYQASTLGLAGPVWYASVATITVYTRKSKHSI